MATRMNVKFTYHHSEPDTEWLYRHWDGYPSVAGVEILRALCKCWTDFANEHGYQPNDIRYCHGTADLEHVLRGVCAELEHKRIEGAMNDYCVPADGQSPDIEWLYTLEADTYLDEPVIIFEAVLKRTKKELKAMPRNEEHKFAEGHVFSNWAEIRGARWWFEGKDKS